MSQTIMSLKNQEQARANAVKFPVIIERVSDDGKSYHQTLIYSEYTWHGSAHFGQTSLWPSIWANEKPSRLTHKERARFLREEGYWDQAERYQLRHDDMEVGQ